MIEIKSGFEKTKRNCPDFKYLCEKEKMRNYISKTREPVKEYDSDIHRINTHKVTFSDTHINVMNVLDTEKTTRENDSDICDNVIADEYGSETDKIVCFDLYILLVIRFYKKGITLWL